MPLVTLVGASNELPESEELDALYDRFLIRRTVNQVGSSRTENAMHTHRIVLGRNCMGTEGEYTV